MKHVTGIVGGIGAGKSVVSRILMAMGYPVYDTDSWAKRIMDTDSEIHADLCRLIHPEAVVDGVINRQLLSDVVFADKSLLSTLNSIVHGKVLSHLDRWISVQTAQHVFVETAIPHSSGLDKKFTDAWVVTADTDVRVARVIERSGLSPENIRRRIRSQSSETDSLSCPAKIIVNNPGNPLLAQINNLL